MKRYLSSCHKFIYINQRPTYRILPNTIFKYSSFHSNADTHSYIFQGFKNIHFIVQICNNIHALKKVHAQLVINGLEHNNFIGAKVAKLYAMFGTLEDARKAFDKICERNVLLWNAMIGEYARNENPEEAIRMYCKMHEEGIQPDNFTLPLVLKACASLSALQGGKEIHHYIIRMGFESDVFVGSALIDMYAKCGSIEDAQLVFDKMSTRDVVLWNAMISGYAHIGYSNEALMLFEQMQLADVMPSSSTIVGLLVAYGYLGNLQQGNQIHGYIVKIGCESNVFVATSLIDLYAKCGSIEDAGLVFAKMSERSVVSWNAMISAYSQNGYANEALKLFHQMQSGDRTLNSSGVVSVLSACAKLGALQQGMWIHDYTIRNGLELDVFVGTALIDMYAKCGMIVTARQLFDNMSKRNVVSWSAMIAGYAHNGYANEALELYNQMQLANVKPNSVTTVSLLLACNLLGALQRGKAIHNYIIRNGFDLDVFVGNTLIDMYAKCGSIELAHQLFNRMSKINLASWNSIIAGYRMHARAGDALALFVQMKQIGMKPDNITFICILSACSHAGLVDEGWQYFGSMTNDYCITPEMKHYACMVDLLGRSGLLDEAQNFIEKMPFKPDASIWGGLLGACRIHCNIDLGERVASYLFELEPDNAGHYVLLSNMYAAAGRWDDVAKVRRMMKERGITKTPGFSLIEVNNKVHAFLVGDRSHPEANKIYDSLKALDVQMKEAGYVPDTNFVLHNVEEEVKENMLSTHSEKLAIAFGLLNTSPRTPIRITKNLRVCGDCHNVTKFISKIVSREIIVRDANRFHHFKSGLCSCGDFW